MFFHELDRVGVVGDAAVVVGTLVQSTSERPRVKRCITLPTVGSIRRRLRNIVVLMPLLSACGDDRVALGTQDSIATT